MLVPIYKKGDVNNVNNYRGISLLNVLSKIVGKILNNRLVEWVESENLLFQEQKGFRRGQSTIDQVFILNTMIQKYLSKRRGRFYCCFVDFAKAFDSVPHLQLWHILVKNGIHGNFLGVLRSMYNKLKSCVLTPKGITEFFQCTIGPTDC